MVNVLTSNDMAQVVDVACSTDSIVVVVLDMVIANTVVVKQASKLLWSATSKVVLALDEIQVWLISVVTLIMD